MRDKNRRRPPKKKFDADFEMVSKSRPRKPSKQSKPDFRLELFRKPSELLNSMIDSARRLLGKEDKPT